MRIPLAVSALALVLTAASIPTASAAPTPRPSGGATAVARPGIAEIALSTANRTTERGGDVIATLAPRSTDRFSMVGVTWARTPSAAPKVEVRTRAGGAWSDWSTLALETLDSEQQSARAGTAPTFTGDADGVEVRVLGAPGAAVPSDLKVSLIDPGRLATDSAPATTRPSADARAASGGMPAMPSIVTRAAWGADESLKARSGASCMTPKIDSTVKAAVVHHTEGTNSYTRAQSAGIVRGIYAYHVTGNGWCDLGYNFLIDRYGQIFEGRAGGPTLPVHGAHAYDWNTNTMGLSIMGNFMRETPPEVALDAAVRLTAWRLAAYYGPSHGRLTIGRYTSDVISGHRQVSETDCPGDAFFAYLPTFRNRVAALMGASDSPIKRRWLELGGATGAAGQPYEGEAPHHGGRLTRFATMDLLQAPDGRVRWVRGAIREKYRSLGDAGGALGFPTTDEICSASGCFQAFDGGVILWSMATGAHTNWGVIRDKYATLDYERGALGYPTTDEVCAAHGCFQGFERGFLLFSPRTGTHLSRGALRDKYAELGFERSFLGYPTTDDACDKAGCWQDYEGGALTYAPVRGTHFSRGAIRATHLRLGGRTGFLGAPSTDEICGLRNSGCVQLFDHEAVYWSPASGAWENRGAIRDAYANQGYENGRLGYPTSGESCDATRCVQRFERGTITFPWGGSAIIS